MAEKTLKFVPELKQLILTGKKTATWRIDDDKDIMVGDNLTFADADSKNPFAKSVVTKVKLLRFKDLTPDDRIGHESYPSDEEMYVTFSRYYGQKVDGNTVLKIIRFKLLN